MRAERRETRQRRLETLLGHFRDDPAFAVLEDRAYDTGHLATEDYERLLGAAEEDQGLINLKRHVIYCDLCGGTFLKLASPAAEELYVRGDRRAAQRRWLLLATLPLVILGLAWVLGWWPFGGVSGDEGAELPIFGLQAREAGTGQAMQQEISPERLFLRLEGDRPRTPRLYAFLLGAGGLVIPIHPDGGAPNPVTPGLVPPGGWVDPGGGPPRQLLGLVVDRDLPTLRTAADLKTVADGLAARLREGADPEALVRILEEILGRAQGRAFLLPLRE